jgi:hypothetical protein
VATLNPHTAQPGDDVPTPRKTDGRFRRGAPSSRVAYGVGIAAVCALATLNLVTGTPAGTVPASADEQSVAVADALGVDHASAPVSADAKRLGEVTASRSQRDVDRAAAVIAQAQAEQAAAAVQAQAAAEAAAATAAAAAAAAEAAKAPASAPAAAPAVPAAPAVTAVATITNSAGPVKPQTQAAANAVVSNVPGAGGITLGGTRASATDPNGHPSGRALDYMVLSDTALGEAIIAYHIAHWDELGVEYIIYKQRMLSSPNGSWVGMEDRGSPTANHMDHVHVNYR